MGVAPSCGVVGGGVPWSVDGAAEPRVGLEDVVAAGRLVVVEPAVGVADVLVAPEVGVADEVLGDEVLGDGGVGPLGRELPPPVISPTVVVEVCDDAPTSAETGR